MKELAMDIVKANKRGILAKIELEKTYPNIKIVGKEQFLCTNEYPDSKKPEPLEFNLTGEGPQKKSIKEKSKLSVAAVSSTKESYQHG